ncbi:uncharacterized protein LTR77_004899 [Saxophila tyrrhenica]|uniref:Uncharacterized protein n=1 Tax=Saxophila tyrrhenica TaxID=1690608 RepID=A0AAV9PDJ3_9PEZI|nr:hypothetical protein LTR77_004899 [Saxophila tyrrhenica]
MRASGMLLFAFVALASTTGIPKLAKYDDLPGMIGASQLNPVGTYLGLTYRSFNVYKFGLKGVAVSGFKPESADQAAGNSITANVITGSPAIYPAAPYKSFDLKSLYFGCNVNTATSAAGLPEQCTIAFTSYLPGSNVAFQTINQQFDPTNAVLSDLTKAVFPASWSKIGRVSLAIVQSTSTTPLAAFIIDNVEYNLYT